MYYFLLVYSKQQGDEREEHKMRKRIYSNRGLGKENMGLEGKAQGENRIYPNRKLEREESIR